MSVENHYKTLNIPIFSSEDVIKYACRNVKVDNSDENTLNAVTVLSDTGTRKKYDSNLRKTHIAFPSNNVERWAEPQDWVFYAAVVLSEHEASNGCRRHICFPWGIRCPACGANFMMPDPVPKESCRRCDGRGKTEMLWYYPPILKTCDICKGDRITTIPACTSCKSYGHYGIGTEKEFDIPPMKSGEKHNLNIKIGWRQYSITLTAEIK